MATFTNEKLKTSFVLSDKITVRAQLAYFSEIGLARGREMWERLWFAARAIIQDWKCEIIPDLEKLNIDEVTDPDITELVIWASVEVKSYMDNLENIPKNS
jgi:hypothetical protein